MNSQEILDIETKHSAGTYVKQPLVIVRGQGASLFDADGVEYLDCASGHGVANLGHAHPKVAEAIYKQASTLITLFETFPNDQRAELMKRLTSVIDGLDRVFLCNSGTEAVEAALKFSRISTGRKNIVAAMRAFHGPAFWWRSLFTVFWLQGAILWFVALPLSSPCAPLGPPASPHSMAWESCFSRSGLASRSWATINSRVSRRSLRVADTCSIAACGATRGIRITSETPRCGGACMPWRHQPLADGLPC